MDTSAEKTLSIYIRDLAGKVALIVAISFSGYLALDNYSKEDLVDSSIIEKNEVIATLSRDIVEKQIQKMFFLGEAVLSNSQVPRLLQDQKWDEALLSLKPIMNAGSSSIYITRILLASPEGDVMADFPTDPEVHGKNFAHRDWYKGAIRTGYPYLSEVYRRMAAPQFNVISIAFPIHNSLGELVGIFNIQLKPGVFRDWVINAKINSSTKILIVDQSGNIVSAPDIDLRGAINNQAADPDVARVIKNKSGSMTFEIDGITYVSSFRPISKYHWGVISRIKVDKGDEP